MRRVLFSVVGISMRNILLSVSYFLICCLSYAQESVASSPAIVKWTVSSGNVFNSGRGMNVSLENIETQDSYSSADVTKHKSAIPPKDGFICVPPGQYVVSRIEIPVGQFLYIN